MIFGRCGLDRDIAHNRTEGRLKKWTVKSHHGIDTAGNKTVRDSGHGWCLSTRNEGEIIGLRERDFIFYPFGKQWYVLIWKKKTRPKENL